VVNARAPFGPRGLRRRHGERGAAVFVVVMALTMLTAIGVFGIRAASLAGAASGYDRQSTQNHYVSEYGLLGAVTELSSGRRAAYVDKMGKGVEQCSAVKGVTNPTGSVPCYHLYANDVQKAVTANFSNRPLFEATSMSGSTITPGSLGPGALDGDFVVEMTDPGPVGMPVAGSDLGGTGPKFRYLQVTLTSTGQVRPSGVNNCEDVATGLGNVDVKGAAAGNETGRAFVVIGPMP
jgi:hypothetical protein